LKEKLLLTLLNFNLNKVLILIFSDIKRSVYGGLLGIFVFVFSGAIAQMPQELSIGEQLDQVDQNFYFTDPDSALYLYQKVASTAQRGGHYDFYLDAHLRMAWCALQHSWIDSFQYFLHRAEFIAQHHQEALDTLDPTRALRVNIPYTWGLFYDESMGDPFKAINAFRPIVVNPTQYQDSMLVSDTYYELGLCYHKLENYAQAIVYRQLALQWLPRQALQEEFSYHQALLQLAIGSSYDQLAASVNSPESLKARKFYDSSLKSLQRYPFSGQARGAVGANYRHLSHWHLARQQYDSALWQLDQLARQYAPSAKETANIILSGDIYLAKGNRALALQHYHRALVITNDSYPGKHVEKASIHNRIGQVHLQNNQVDIALWHFQQALVQQVVGFDNLALTSNPALSEANVTKNLLESLSSKALTLYLKNEATPHDTASLLQAWDTHRLVIEATNQMRQTFPSLEYKQFVSAKAASLYEQAIRTCLQAVDLNLTQDDFLAEAFYFSEKSKAATLLEAVRTSEAHSFSAIPDELVEEENKLKQELTYWENQRYQAEDNATQQMLRNRAFETRETYNALIKRLEKEYPNYYQLKYDTKVTGLRELQRHLPPHTTLLSFSYGDSTLYTFAIRSDDVQWRATPLDSSFHRSLANVLRSVSQYDYQQASDLSVFSAFTKDANGLYQTLLAPWLSEENKTEQLIIIPDGLLGYLPFDVLLTEKVAPTRVDYQALPYLVKQLPVSYEYSATLLTAPAPPSDEAPYAYLGFAPSYPEAPLAKSREVRTTLDGKRLGLGQLRHNREEIAFAAQLFRGQTFVNEAATEARFKQYAPQSRVLHLSMHAYANNENDNFSGLIFTQQPDTVPEDGFLHANELYNLSLNSELAVLSACETGIGTLAPGEGIMSLGRAFKYAGCPNVTMSLWNADDQSTSRIMQRFFTHLHQGVAKDQALRTAKLDYLDGARSAQAHPYYWASFVQVGNSDPLSAAGGFSGWWWVAGALVPLALLLGVLRYRRARITL
jgi:CHAT domain-containing protein/tetratricopeptide (TPR) repeat protein